MKKVHVLVFETGSAHGGHETRKHLKILIFTLIPDASLDQEVGAARRRLLGRGRFRHGEDQTFYFYLEDFTLAKNRRRWFKSMSEPPPKNGLD